MDSHVSGRPAGRTGPRRLDQCGVRADHTENNVLKPWQQNPWGIPPPSNADCVWAMEDVLEVYRRPDDPQRPQVCLDETRTHLVAATRSPIPAAPGQPARRDDAYERQGTAHLGMVCAPLAGQRWGQGTARRTAVDVAQLLRAVVDEPYPQAAKMVLVRDHLNTPKPASLDAACAPAEARRLMARLESHDTPKHGRGLNRAETDLSVLTTPCLDRRIPDQITLSQEVAAGGNVLIWAPAARLEDSYRAN